MQILTNGRRTAKKTKKLPSRIKGRRKLPSEIFVFPEERSFPIPDAHHAGLALSALMRMAGRHGVDSIAYTPGNLFFTAASAGEADIVAAVKRRYRLRAIYSSSPSPSFFTLLSKMIEKYD